MIREAHFQTAMRLSLKKEEERNAIPYKKEQPFIHGTKETKKKKKSKTLKPKTYFPIKIILGQTTDSSLLLQTHRSDLCCNKNPKTQIVFADQNSDSLRPPILHCSFKHTDRTCVATKTLKPKSYLPIKIQTHSDYRFFAVPSNTQIGLACSTLSNRRKKKPLQRWRSPFVPCNRRFISYPASALQQ